MKKNYTLIVLILLATGARLSSQNFNRPVPVNVPPYQFNQNDTNYYGYYLTSPFHIGMVGNTEAAITYPKPLMILDQNGYLLWYMPVHANNLLDFKYYPEQQLYSFVKFISADDIRFMVMDADLQLVDSFTTVNGITPDVHDFSLTGNNTFLLSGLKDSIMDLSTYLFNGYPGSSQTHALGFVVQEQDENHQVLFEWNSNDHVFPTEAYDFYGYSATGFDYSHGNAIFEDSDGGLLLSFRHTNAVYKIDRVTGEIEWQLGGKSSSFTFANDAGFSGQHAVRRLPNGNITLFDNANMAAVPKISRAVEYSLDTVNWVATKVWEYQYTPGFLSPAMGNYQSTDSREHLVNYGLNYRPNPSFVLADDNGGLLSEAFFQDSFMSYRSFIFDIPLQDLERPVVTCSRIDNNLVLNAPSGFEHYEWSNGESDASIIVGQTGVYQVWVDHGDGMLGSEPFIVDDLENACESTGIEGPVSEAQQVIACFDLLGRKVSWPVKGNMYVVRYADGTARIQFWNE